jgi:uncharacterized membrane-anchored protein
MRSRLVLGGLVLVLTVPNVSIARKERLLATGETMLVELAPVDPRSLIQGDYMRLDYAIARQLATAAGRDWPRDGRLVVTLDEHGVAWFVRRHEGGALNPGEHLLRYRRRGSQTRIGTNAFFFQEGHAQRYQGARYGELRVDRSGASVLVGLRDSTRRALR